MKSIDQVAAALKRVLSRNPEFRKKLARVLREERAKTAALDRDYHVWQSLHKLTERAPQILELMRAEPEDVETWHEHNVNLASEYLDAVFDSLSCKSDDAVGCDAAAPDEAVLEEEVTELPEMNETAEEPAFMRMASPVPTFDPPRTAPRPPMATPSGPGAVKVKLLLVLLFDVLGRMEMWPPGTDSALTRANLEANRSMAPPDRQRARSLASKLARILAQLALPSAVEAAILSRTLLDAVQSAVQSAEVSWAAPLEPVLVKLNLTLRGMLDPAGRAKQLQMAMRLNGIVDRLV
jgi:hypothetical protein